MRRSMRVLALLAAILGLAATVTACGNDATDQTSQAGKGAEVIDVTFKDDAVQPNGKLVDVKVGQEVELEVKADKAGQIHVHSDPEQQKDYGVGTTRISLGAFKVPGQFVVESHVPEKTIVILQVQ